MCVSVYLYKKNDAAPQHIISYQTEKHVGRGTCGRARFHNICVSSVYVWMCQNGKQVQNATVCTEKLKKYTGNMYVYIVINYVYVYRTITTVHLIVRMHIYLFSVKYFSPFQSLGFFKKSYPSVNIFPFLFG